jgi:hypothetical protein
LFLSSSKLSLFSQNARGSFDTNNLMKIAPIALKASFIIICSFISFPPFFSFIFLIMPPSCLLSLSTDPRRSFLHFGVVRGTRDSIMKK